MVLHLPERQNLNFLIVVLDGKTPIDFEYI
jgi:hypothetical protein